MKMNRSKSKIIWSLIIILFISQIYMIATLLKIENRIVNQKNQHTKKKKLSSTQGSWLETKNKSNFNKKSYKPKNKRSYIQEQEKRRKIEKVVGKEVKKIEENVDLTNNKKKKENIEKQISSLGYILKQEFDIKSFDIILPLLDYQWYKKLKETALEYKKNRKILTKKKFLKQLKKFKEEKKGFEVTKLDNSNIYDLLISEVLYKIEDKYKKIKNNIIPETWEVVSRQYKDSYEQYKDRLQTESKIENENVWKKAPPQDIVLREQQRELKVEEYIRKGECEKIQEQKYKSECELENDRKANDF